MSELTSMEARDGFSDALNRAAYGRERIVITRRGRPLAVLVPVADLEQLEHKATPTAPAEDACPPTE